MEAGARHGGKGKERQEGLAVTAKGGPRDKARGKETKKGTEKTAGSAFTGCPRPVRGRAYRE